MNKLFLIFILTFSLLKYNCITAQIAPLRSLNFSAGIDANVAERTLRETHQWGLGATGKVEYVFARHTSVTGSVGFVQFVKNKLSFVDVKPLGGIPIKTGLRYYLGNFYVSSEAGIVIKTGFLESNAFVYSFAVGDEIVTSKRNHNSLDISLRHEGWIKNRQLNFLGLRLAYEFGFKQY
jgi:hypothetical protein